MGGQDPLGELSQALERADLLDLTARAFRKRPKPLGEQQQENLPNLPLASPLASSFSDHVSAMA